MHPAPAKCWRRSRRRVDALLGHLRAEDAGGTVYALFVLSLSLMLGGLAIDTANAMRARSELAVIADLAAHAGAVTLAQGASRDDVQDSIESILALNGAGSLLHTQPSENELLGSNSPISFLKYDPELNQLQALSEDGPEPNAVALEVRFDQANNTALPTYFLSMIGITSWNIGRKSVTAIVPPSHCAEGDAVVSRDFLLGEGKMTIGDGFCLHAQKRMEFSRAPEVQEGARLSLPNLDDCHKGCADLLATADSRSALSELNVLQPDYHDHIETLFATFAYPATESQQREEFFAQRPISEDLSALAEVGVEVRDLETGAVVNLDPMQVRLARRLPQGLVYRVSCAEHPQDTFLLLGSPGPRMNGSVLLTDCPVVVSRTSGLSRSLVISTWRGIAGADLPAIEVMASSKAETCRSSRSVLMAHQPIYLLPGASADGLGLVSATDVALFASTEGNPRTDHLGLSLFAGSTVFIEGDHRFDACAVQDAEELLPPMRIIRQVMPNNMNRINPPAPPTPGRPRFITPREPSHNGSRDDLLAALP